MSGVHIGLKGHRDFRRLWFGRAVSQLGSDVGAVAFPVVAVAVVGASTGEVALMSALGAATAAILALPMGGHVEYRRKRPVLIGADLVRFAGLASIPVAAAFGVLGFAQLCVVAVVNAAAQIAFATASAAHLKALVPAEQLVDGNARLESTTWFSLTVGRSLGGLLVGVLTALGTLIADAVSFLAGAWSVTRIKAPEPPPPVRVPGESARRRLLGGLRFVRGDPVLRRMLAGWLAFAGASAMAFPVSTVFYLRDLQFSAWQYGLLMGLPSLGGVAGARLVRRLTARYGTVRVLRWASLARGPWQFLIPLAVPGPWGLAMCGLGFGMVLFFASIANTAMTAHRQLCTPDELQVRVAALWAFATRVGGPVFMLAGGLLAGLFGERAALMVAAGLMCAAPLLLPRADGSGAGAGTGAPAAPARSR